MNPIPKIIVLTGESGSGKSYFQKKLIENNSNFKKIVIYTTRPKRDNEVDGEDYYFVDNEYFTDMKDNGCFIECAKYRDWFYGIAKSSINQVLDDKENVYVIVLTPKGKRNLMKYLEEEPHAIFSYYLKTDERQRLKKLIDRGDDINEIFRRYLTELGQFDGVEEYEARAVFNRYNEESYLKFEKWICRYVKIVD